MKILKISGIVLGSLIALAGAGVALILGKACLELEIPPKDYNANYKA